jgi:hypothetical protein
MRRIGGDIGVVGIHLRWRSPIRVLIISLVTFLSRMAHPLANLTRDSDFNRDNQSKNLLNHIIGKLGSTSEGGRFTRVGIGSWIKRVVVVVV